MTKRLMIGAMLLLGSWLPAAAQDKVTLQLKWVTQAQFAGYYAAVEKGYYKAAGLNVNIKIGGPSITPELVVKGKQAEFGIDWLPNLFATREQKIGEDGERNKNCKDWPQHATSWRPRAASSIRPV